MATAKRVEFPAGADRGSAWDPNGGEGHLDIEAGGRARAPASAPTTTPKARGQRLASLDVFRGITVVVSGFFHSIHDLTYGVDVREIRLMGILQRIAIAYLVVALCEIWLRGGASNIGAGSYALIRRYRHQLFVGLVLTVTYTGLLYGMYVPDWEYEVKSQDGSLKNFMVKCGVRGDTGPGCNAVAMIDRRVLGIHHLYTHPVYLKTAEHVDRIVRWSIPSLSLLIIGFSLDLFGLHLNKSLYSLSYTCVTTGTAGLFFAGIYLLLKFIGIGG
ncbi:hypothetical protein BAE44_0013929 [Dichanthelium oligosanthes]|uniref:Heparan-alpha-glucosaminide N-acetyltransferase catalytic domain-containing protein n=1 Tax=Dichanthelium oligosanthes TaxID=888268 RepID=A0A1E5VIT1_9POAL|nr:hypothetical protein BAE44_0013929 [Dichanthelium oligosanthes]